jgi:hypothetical protein
MIVKFISRQRVRFFGAAAIALLLAGCGESSTDANVAQDAAQANPQDTPQTAPANVAGNGAPSISGTPTASVAAGAAYVFLPSASDPEHQAIGFSIANKPSWAIFNTASGMLTGTPAAGAVGTFANIVISVTDGTTQVALPAFAIEVTATPVSGQPTISGAPSTTARVGSPYAFQPAAQDPNGDALTYSIASKPAWLSFNTKTGALTGTPGAADLGSYSNIAISVSDGKLSASIAAFSILVTAPAMGSATLSWSPPTANTDGSSLTNLGGYHVYYGTDQAAMTKSIQITNPGLTSYTVGSLSAGTYYFAVSAYTTDGVEGERSPAGSKTIM